MSDSLITSEVDFDADGKHCGFLRLPHSVHRSAYGWIPIPIVMISNGDGPTALLISGNHGDEYEGQVALSKLCHELSPDQVRGRLIILTMVHFQRDGVIISKRIPSRVERGDCLYQTGSDEK